MRSDYVSAQSDAPVFQISADTALFFRAPDSSWVSEAEVTSLCKGYATLEGAQLENGRGHERFLTEIKAVLTSLLLPGRLSACVNTGRALILDQWISKPRSAVVLVCF